MADLILDPASTALVLIDLQHGIAGPPTAPHAAADVVGRAARLARRFREVRASSPEWATIVPELGPEPGDAVVTKHRPSAFYATDLEVHLRRRAIRTIVLGGISTNVGVEADLHAFTVSRLFPTIGRVRSTGDVLDALG